MRQVLPELRIGDLVFSIPVIQGGMGVGISRSGLAGAVSREGGLGILSTAQIGYDEPGFTEHPIETNLKAIGKHIHLAKEISGGRPVGVNIMVATKEYESYVKAAAASGADVIISGAGLPMTLPALTEGSDALIAPIVSSEKAAKVMLQMWDRKYKRTADFLVVEGPLAGGHLGFAKEDLEDIHMAEYEKEIQKILLCRKIYEEKYGKPIPVVVAGGIFDHADICHMLELGADGVQMASRFVVTEECDAHPAFKQAYLDAKSEDICIMKSPVGMPGRALHNRFIKQTEENPSCGVTERCLQCVKTCTPAQTPYCISRALIRAVQGDVENGLVFCGAEIGRLTEMTTVPKIMAELSGRE